MNQTASDTPQVQRIVIKGRNATDMDSALIYTPLSSNDLVMAPIAAMATQLPWGKPHIGKPKRNKTRGKMQRESRRLNRGK